MKETEKKNKNKEVKKLNFIGCKSCGRTNVTLIKAQDSYYCKDCFNDLHRKYFIKDTKVNRRK